MKKDKCCPGATYVVKDNEGNILCCNICGDPEFLKILAPKSYMEEDEDGDNTIPENRYVE